MLYRNRPPFPDNRIYLTILWLMVVNIVVGALLALFGERVFDSSALAHFGTGLMLVAGIVYFFFRWLGLREGVRRRQAASRDQAEGERPGQD
ncbi:hypothetical protein ACFOW6_12490 [Fodinicurvata halophila]|uniref:Uncharacterized protein n=1 Tax=Fodinicurvata halophila TaxID=1419723 RepID=A0ABV8UMT9_9PROT